MMLTRNNKNRKAAREYFGITGQPDMVLHHKDETLKERDLDRYLEWRTEDLVAITKGEHTTIHHKGKTQSMEARQKMRENHVGFKGRYHAPESVEKIRKKLKGKRRSAAARRNIRENHAHLFGADNPASIPVLCVETSKIYSCAVEAARDVGISPSGITRCCNHIKNYNTAGGYHWRHAND